MQKNSFIKITIALFLSVIFTANCGDCIALAYNNYINEISLKISEELKTKMNDSPDDEKISVMIFFDETEVESNNIQAKIINENERVAEILTSNNYKELSKSEQLDVIHELRAKKVEAAKEKYSVINQLFAKSLGDDITIEYISTLSPIIIAAVNNEDILKLSAKNTVSNIMCNVEPTATMDVARQTIRAHTVQNSGALGYTGAGVNVGVLDADVPDTMLANFSGANIVVHSQSSHNLDSHSDSVVQVIAGQGVSSCAYGIAPDVNLYCIASNLSVSLDWLLDAEKPEIDPTINSSVDVINMSISYLCGGEYNNPDKIIDFYSKNYNVTIVVAAGNHGATNNGSEENGVTSPGMAYNAICVANVDDRNTTSISDDKLAFSTKEIDGVCYPMGSSYNNRQTEINVASKPDISAPGSSIQLAPNLPPTGGTSIAAPMVTGAVALMGEQDPLILYFPYAVKAILTTGVHPSRHCYVPAQRTVSTDLYNAASSYIQYGAGMLNCVGNAIILNSEQYDFSYMSADETNYSFNKTFEAGQKLRISLAFEHPIEKIGEKSNGDPICATHINNLDLYVYDNNNNLITSSTTVNNNVEIVEFTPATSGNYKIKISRGTTGESTDVGFSYSWYQ